MTSRSVQSKQFSNNKVVTTIAKHDFVFQAETSREIHALCCSAKPLSTFIARDAIKESREACGSHGYLKGKIRLI